MSSKTVTDLYDLYPPPSYIIRGKPIEDKKALALAFSVLSAEVFSIALGGPKGLASLISIAMNLPVTMSNTLYRWLKPSRAIAEIATFFNGIKENVEKWAIVSLASLHLVIETHEGRFITYKVGFSEISRIVRIYQFSGYSMLTTERLKEKFVNDSLHKPVTIYSKRWIRRGFLRMHSLLKEAKLYDAVKGLHDYLIGVTSSRGSATIPSPTSSQEVLVGPARMMEVKFKRPATSTQPKIYGKVVDVLGSTLELSEYLICS